MGGRQFHGWGDWPERALVPERSHDRRTSSSVRGLGLGWLDPGADLHQLCGKHGDILQSPDHRHVAGAGTFNPDGSLGNPGIWGNPTTFYQTDPSDHYAQFMHSIAINNQQYAFPYDDSGGYSSDVSCTQPQTLLVAIGW